MSIDTLQLDGYRSFREQTFRFHPGVNVIVGPSDSGKSNIVRALRDLFYGQQRGKQVCSVHEAAWSVVATIDGVRFGWRGTKTGKGNRSGKRSIGSDATTLDKQQRESRIAPVDLDENVKAIRLNIVGQHDSPFLVSESPIVIAKLLGSMSGAHVIYAAQRHLNADIRKTSTNADKFEHEVQLDADSLAGLADAHETIMGLVQRKDEALLRWRRSAMRASSAQNDAARLTNDMTVLRLIRHESTRLPALVARTSVALSSFCASRDRAHSATRSFDRLRVLASALRETRSERAQAASCLSKARARLDSVTACPTCGVPIGNTSRIDDPDPGSVRASMSIDPVESPGSMVCAECDSKPAFYHDGKTNRWFCYHHWLGLIQSRSRPKRKAKR